MNSTHTKRVPDWRRLLRFELEHRNVLRIWEPLPITAPPEARPYCCFNTTVIFYSWTDRICPIARCETKLMGGGAFGSQSLIFHRGSWWVLGSGRVVHDQGRWWMRHQAWRNHRNAMRLNGEDRWLPDRGTFPWYWRGLRPVLDLLRQMRVIPGRPPRGFDVPPAEGPMKTADWIHKWGYSDEGEQLFCWIGDHATLHLRLDGREGRQGVPTSTWWTLLTVDHPGKSNLTDLRELQDLAASYIHRANGLPLSVLHSDGRRGA